MNKAVGLSAALTIDVTSAGPNAIRLQTGAPAANESKNQQEQQRANSGVDDRADDPRANVDAELRQEPPTNEGSDNPDDKIADDPEPSAAHNLRWPLKTGQILAAS